MALRTGQRTVGDFTCRTNWRPSGEGPGGAGRDTYIERSENFAQFRQNLHIWPPKFRHKISKLNFDTIWRIRGPRRKTASRWSRKRRRRPAKASSNPSRGSSARRRPESLIDMTLSAVRDFGNFRSMVNAHAKANGALP